MDFYKIREWATKSGVIEVYPDFRVCRSKDLMVRGKDFYAVWDEAQGLWSTDEYDVQRLVDEDLYRYSEELKKTASAHVLVKYMGDFSSSSWLNFQRYIHSLSDSSHQLDESLTFANSVVKKEDYVSKRLPYALEDSSFGAYDELIGALYDEEEREKLEWSIGSIISGDSKDIQKFVVLYGSAGTGKSTVLNIIQDLFQGYFTVFEAKALTGSNNSFATEAFRANPLVAIQHDGDLSKIEDNTKLNSIVSHEQMIMNEKYKASYSSRINAFLFMGTNKAVKITDAKSGLIRRLIDIHPSGRRVPPQRYQVLMSQIQFELGGVAKHCLDTYRSMGRDYYASYQPVEMMLQTDVFYNFIESYFDYFDSNDGVTLVQAYAMYRQFCEETLIEYKLPQYRFREELKNYFLYFEERARIGETRVRSWYSGFKSERFDISKPEEKVNSLVLDKTVSLIDELYSECPAQYANVYETPSAKWSTVETTLSDLNTTQLHYVKPPTNHIVIDFDLKDEEGNKSPQKNLEAASKWPPTYAEYSKGGGGVHLHYKYIGDANSLSRLFDENIEIKVFVGDASLRRRLSLCNDLPIASISGGLPLKEKKVINQDKLKSEKSLRELIARNLRKEIHPGTKPSIDFIHKILEDAYNSDLEYNVEDLRPKILAFANNSTNQSLYCLKLVSKMKFASEPKSENSQGDISTKAPIVFFDCEVFPNLFHISWKYEGDDVKCVHMTNPSPSEVEELCRTNLIGFNNLNYDNHILYAAIMGYTNQQLFELSKKIIAGDRGAKFYEAKSLSYTDIYDYSSKKQSLKKWEIELGIHHQEVGIPWDQPVPKEQWPLVIEYCDNDVYATEAVHKARHGDFVAREILAKISGLSVNHSTNEHTTHILVGNNRNPQSEFVYTDLSEMFPGYKYEFGHSSYRGEDPGEGGYIYEEVGMYENVALLDVASMHPTSIVELNLFGPYTKNLENLLNTRLAIKHREYNDARKMFGGILAPYLESDEDADALSYALKIAINSVYGLTAASFSHPLRDIRNKDNIVAKRGALFMIDLKHFVQERGFTVAHIKTDSIKIPNATSEIIEEIMEFGLQYGYTFEHEATYEKMCLVNRSVYIAKTKQGRKPSYWTATGAQFKHPYVFKTLFSHEPITFKDYEETKQVKTAIYLDFSADKPMISSEVEKPHFIGKVGSFVPIKPGCGGAALVKTSNSKEGFDSVTGASGYLWMESEMVKQLGKQDDIDESYFTNLVDKAVENMSKYGDVEKFLGDDHEAIA